MIRAVVPTTPVLTNLSLTGNCLGNTATVSVDARGANLTYQWQRREPGSNTFVSILGATDRTYSTGPVTLADDQARYRVIVSSGAASTTSGELILSPILVEPTVVFDFLSGVSNVTLFGDAMHSAGDGVVLTPTAGGGRYGALLLPELATDALVRGFKAAFLVRVERGNGFADGFSFNWATDLPEYDYETAEEGAGNGLRVCFDLFDNDGGEGPAIDVKWGTNTIASYHTDNGFLPGFAEDFALVTMRLHADGTFDLNYRCTQIFSRLPIPGYKPLLHARFGMGARTGGTYAGHIVGNLALELLASAPLLDTTVPGGPIAATSGNSPAAQMAPNAIDNIVTNKYLNFDKLNTGLSVTPIGRQPVRALTLMSAEDAPERDPSSFVLEGSNDGTNFTRIASNAVPAFPTRQFIRSFALTNTYIFDTYRLRFPTLSNAAAANSMQIAEVEFLNYEELTSSNDAVSITLPPGAADVRGVGALFDRQLGVVRKLEIAPITNSPTIVNLTLAAGAKVLKGFELIGATDDLVFPGRRPSSVTVAGSTDGTHYTNVATVIPAAPIANSQIQEFLTAPNTAAFVHYRITFGAPVSGNRLQVGEMRLFGEDEPLPVLAVQASGTNVLLRWPNTSGFTLESKVALTNGNWNPVGIAPFLSNGVNTVTLPVNGDAAFFRLRK